MLNPSQSSWLFAGSSGLRIYIYASVHNQVSKFDNFNVSGCQLTSGLFSDDTPAVSCMCLSNNTRFAGKRNVGPAELVLN